jgi:hypothetical protein
MKKWVLGGGRSISELGYVAVWMRGDNSNSRKFWSDTKMFLLGTRVSWVAILLGNIL